MISAIAAVGNTMQLGLNGGLPWPKHADDMAWFREITAGKVMVAGYNTYEAIKHLDRTLGRSVVQYNAPWQMNIIANFIADEIIIIGGASTYRAFASYINQLYLSRINYDGPAGCYFPIETFTSAQIKNIIWRDE